MKKSLLVVFMVMALLVAFAVTASANEAATTEPKTVEVVITRSEVKPGENGALTFTDKAVTLKPNDTLKVIYKLDGEWADNNLAGYKLTLQGGAYVNVSETATSTDGAAVKQISVEKLFTQNQVKELTCTISKENGDTVTGNIIVTVGKAAPEPTFTVATNNEANYDAVPGGTNEFYHKESTASGEEGGIAISVPKGYTIELGSYAEGENTYGVKELTSGPNVSTDDQKLVVTIPYEKLFKDKANEITVPVTWEYARDEKYYATEGKAWVSFTLYGSAQNAASLALDWELGAGEPYQYTTDDKETAVSDTDSPKTAVELTGGETFTLHVNSDVKSVAFTGTYEGADIRGISMSGVSGNTVEFTVAAGATETITVTAASGRTQVYTIKVVADLDEAVLESVELTFADAQGGTATRTVTFSGKSAQVNVPSGYQTLTGIKYAYSEGATGAEVDESLPYALETGGNQFVITVTARGGEEDTYVLTVTRGELRSATVAFSSSTPTSYRTDDPFTVSGTYTGNFVELTATNATVGATSSADGRFTATVTPEDGTTAAITVTATAEGDGVNLAEGKVTATRTVNYLTTAPDIDLYFGTSPNDKDYLTDEKPEKTTYSNRHDLDLSASVDNFYITWSVPTGYDKDLVALSIDGTQIDDVRSGNGYYRVHLENDWYDSSYRTFTIQYKYAGSTVQTYYYTLHQVGNLYLAEVGYNDEDSTASRSNYEEIRLTAGKTFYVEDIRDSAFDWDDTLYFYAEASRSAYDVEVRYHANSSVSWSKADRAERVSRTSDFWEIPYEEGDEVYVYVLVEDDGDELETYTFALNGEESTLELDDLEAATGTASRDDDYTIVPGMTGGVYDYYILVPYSMRSEAVYVRADASRSYDVYVDGGSTDENGDWVKIASSASSAGSFKIEVVDGSDRGEYTVHVEVAPRDADDDDQLDDITIKSAAKSSTRASSRHSVSLSPSFSSSKTSYTAYSSEEYVWVSVDGTRDQLIFVNGEKVSYNGTSAAIKLEKGRNEVEVITVAENCDDITTYEIDVMYQSSVLLESLSVGSSTMSPAFSATSRNYIAHVGANVSSISISARAQDDSAAIAIGSSAYGEGRASGSVSLQPGVNVVTVYVGSRTSGNYYTISIYRETANPTVVVSNQKIAVDNGSAQTLTAYNIGGNNFLQLRDLAALLRNTDAAFSLSYNDSTRTATMTSGGTYRLTGLENAALAKYKSCVASNQSFVLDRASVYPMAYNIDGVNYVMIRDLACLMDFGVSYSDSARTLYVDTDGSYSPAY